MPHDEITRLLSRKNAAAPYLSALLAEHLSSNEWDLASVTVHASNGESYSVDLTKKEDLLLYNDDVIDVSAALVWTG